ncbi:MAG: helix-turn-helix transcriptional regulator [Clostridia bacterium]|nr:helix-turn-helix transcriptional regulator [Clostridia bacterium]
MRQIPNWIVVTQVEDVVTVSSPKGRQVSIHNRRNYGLSFCLEGQITYTHKGREYISDRNHAVLLPRGESYTLYGDKTGRFPLINFQCEGLLLNTHEVIPLEHPEAFLKTYEEMRALWPFAENRLRVLSLFYDLLDRLTGEPNRDPLAPALLYIEQHYREPDLNNAALARQCRISEVYLRKLFVKQYGKSPRHYLIDVRIQKAKQLLSEGTLKVAAVSEQCGFSNPYHFCRSFKSAVGVTPTEYMMEHRVLSL